MTSAEVKSLNANGKSTLCWDTDLDKGQHRFKEDEERVLGAKNLHRFLRQLVTFSLSDVQIILIKCATIKSCLLKFNVFK